MTPFIEILLWIFFGTAFGLMANLLLAFTMHFLMPRKVLETYFKEPYFGAGEIAMLTGFPLGYMRTAMFMGILGFPASGKKRGVEDAYKLAPAWYCKISKYSTAFFVIIFPVFMLSGGIGYFYILIYE